MSRIAKHALLPSLLATAFAGTAVASADHSAKRTNGRATVTNRCPSCADSGAPSETGRELLADGSAVEATRQAVRSILGLGLEDAEEAAQEAALRALKKDVAACCSRGMHRWLFRTAKNFVLDTKRKKREQLLSAQESADGSPLPLPGNDDVGPLDIVTLADEVESTLERSDLGSMSPEKKVQLGRALGARLQSDRPIPRYLPRAAAIVDHARAAVQELTPRG